MTSISNSDHLRKNEALQESEDMYRTLLENLPQKIFLKDKNSVYISCNKNYARDLKIKVAEIVGKTDYDFYSKKLAESYRIDDKRIMKSGTAEDIEEEYLQDGRKVFVHTVKTPVRDEKGNIIGILGVFWDISEKKKAEDELKESEERYRLLFETSHDAIMTLAPPSWNFTSGNAATLELFGVKNIKAFVSMPPWMHSPKFQPDGQSSANKAKKMIDIAMKKGSNFFEWTHKKPNGVNFFVSVLLTKMSIGKKTFLQATVRDITERKKAEEELKKHREHLEDMVESRTAELKKEIVERKQVEKLLRESEYRLKETAAKLRKQKLALEQKNIALSEIIAQIEVEKRKIKNDIATNVNELLLPILEKLKLEKTAGKYVDLLKNHLGELVSSFGRKIRGKRLNLTSREIEICDMIKGRLTSKEISNLLNISYQTVEKHRKNIRRKMGIRKKDINLTSFLQSI